MLSFSKSSPAGHMSKKTSQLRPGGLPPKVAHELDECFSIPNRSHFKVTRGSLWTTFCLPNLEWGSRTPVGKHVRMRCLWSPAVISDHSWLHLCRISCHKQLCAEQLCKVARGALRPWRCARGSQELPTDGCPRHSSAFDLTSVAKHRGQGWMRRTGLGTSTVKW